MKIEIDVLEEATKAVFKHLKEQKITDLKFDEDFYWNITQEDRYNPYDEPKELTLGQLSDDWLEIKKIASGENETIGFALVWLASLYKIIGEKHPY